MSFCQFAKSIHVLNWLLNTEFKEINKYLLLIDQFEVSPLKSIILFQSVVGTGM